MDLLTEIIEQCNSEGEISDLLNNTKTVLGNHLYHEAASRGNCAFLVFLSAALFAPKPPREEENFFREKKLKVVIFGFSTADEVIDILLDQPNFECDPLSRIEGDTPLHSAIRWINTEGERNWEYGNHLVDMMLEAGSSTRAKNKAKLTPFQLVDPRNQNLRDLIMKHEYANLNRGDFVDAGEVASGEGKGTGATGLFDGGATGGVGDDDAEFSGSDEEERAEWERRRRKGGQ